MLSLNLLYTLFTNEIIETFKKTEAISMSGRGNQTKVKIKMSQGKYFNFDNFEMIFWDDILEVWDEIELDSSKTVESKLGVKPKKKRKPEKNKMPKCKINVEKEIETMRGEMLILSEREKNKYPKTRNARKVIGKYKTTSVNDI